jgi:hypothetical protein
MKKTPNASSKQCSAAEGPHNIFFSHPLRVDPITLRIGLKRRAETMIVANEEKIRWIIGFFWAERSYNIRFKEE